MASKRTRRRSAPTERMRTVWPFGDHYSGSGPREFGYYQSSRLGKVFALAAIWGVALCVVIVVVSLLAYMS